MKTPFTAIMLSATLPFLASGQDAPATSTPARVTPGRPLQKTLPKPAELGVRTADQSGPTVPSSVLQNWADPKWEPTERWMPRLTLRTNEATISGPLVDTFRRRPASGEATLGQRILGLPIINMFVPAPLPKPTRQGAYFVWGEREQPWSATCEATRPGPVGVLVATRF